MPSKYRILTFLDYDGTKILAGVKTVRTRAGFLCAAGEPFRWVPRVHTSIMFTRSTKGLFLVSRMMSQNAISCGFVH